MKNLSQLQQTVSCVVLTLLLMFVPAGLYAQKTISVSGVVIDSNNEPIIGAAVQVRTQAPVSSQILTGVIWSMSLKMVCFVSAT